MPRLAGRDMCTGCSACLAACPRGCISMVRDEEGFPQPSVGDGCVECGRCSRICPLLSGARGNSVKGQLAVAAIAKDDRVWESSASGGAFTCACEAFAAMDPDAETVVYGAEMVFPKVAHRRHHVSDMEPLRRSKYVQSDMGTAFRDVRSDLRAGRRVVFSGTPCQVAGLTAYLGAESSSPGLLLVDLICHGVGSPSFFEACMAEESERHGEVVGYSFRNKVPFVGNYERYLSRYEYLDRYRYERMDDYNKMFLSQLCLRRSCAERCPFRTRERFGDVTLADLNGKGTLFPELDDPRGWSSVVASTDKGRDVLSRLGESMEVLASSPDDVARFNPLFERTTPGNPQRDEFFSAWIGGADIESLVRRFWKRPSARARLMRYVPYRVKATARRILRKTEER